MSEIVADLIASLGEDSPVRGVQIGIFWAAVLAKGCGLAAVLSPEESLPHGTPLVERAGELDRMTGLELAQYAHSERLLEASVGMAALNSMLEVEESRCSEQDVVELLLEKGRGRNVALVGDFPFAPRVGKVARSLWVIEKRPRKGEWPESEAERLLPQADVVGITGSAFVNHTIEHLLELCPPQSFVLIMGPTTPLSPILFDYGVDALGGILVADEKAVLRDISQGATFRQVRGVKKVVMLR